MRIGESARRAESRGEYGDIESDERQYRLFEGDVERARVIHQYRTCRFDHVGVGYGPAECLEERRELVDREQGTGQERGGETVER